MLRDRKVILHANSAKSCKLQFPGVLRDKVCIARYWKKGVKVSGHGNGNAFTAQGSSLAN